MITVDFSSTSKKRTSSSPRSIGCYICGRQYMVHSFEIHENQCRSLFIERENLKPIKQRRKCPDNPFANKIGLTNLNELNDVAYQSYTTNLSTCQYCNRKFSEDKLKIHNRSCTSSNPARRIDESVNRRTSISDIKQMEYSLDRIESNDINFKRTSIAIIPAELQQCPHCNRSFNERSFEKHTRICKKVFVDKRRVFDSTKKRIEGTEAAFFNKKIKSSIKSSGILFENNKRKQDTSTIKSSKWRQQSQQFRQAMKAARMVSNAENESRKSGIPLSTLLKFSKNEIENENADYIQCPTCNRKYSRMAGERHIPLCSNIRNKPSLLLAGSGHVATTFRDLSIRDKNRRNSFDIDIRLRRETDKPKTPSKSIRFQSASSNAPSNVDRLVSSTRLRR